jgi:predicted Zn-ribbon and HTH transcriptional regulator
MGFVPITIDKYLSLHFKKNPADNEADLRKRLLSALNDHKNGIKCSCGNDIWIIGSVFVGNACFTCITGEAYPTEDYEIDSAITKKENKKGRRHIDDIEPTKIAGFFDDAGYEINSDLIKKPSLCLICKNDDNPEEEMLCNMTRYDQKDDNGFKCFAFSKK